ncbi:MAG TPA: DNA polymerase III subunit gamma/tau, partial [Candidatus Saccharimonadales bacterium]|nr:DNA polymerase III subunit gamma/tau [Candidatus Saccharimonadales bacterium]
MAQALYRKNRPKSLDDVIGQEHIITTLKNAIKTGKISHAYLFTGPRGVGKTSVARILAHEVNKSPYNEESTHIDIIEIDAASNRRIDEIRDLRDKVHIAPTSSKYKVYIVDEVHMLTKEAFNALLKTLEEPPAHVIFILATTEAHKLPETIISRTQRFNFKPIEIQLAIERLRQMAKAEKIEIDDKALALIAEHGDGSFRDSISLLDQASSSDKNVNIKDIERMLGIAPADALQKLVDALSDSSPQELLELLTGLREQGYQASHLAKQLSQTLRAQLISGKTSLPVSRITELLKQLLEVTGSSQPDRLLE